MEPLLWLERKFFCAWKVFDISRDVAFLCLWKFEVFMTASGAALSGYNMPQLTIRREIILL